MDLPITNIIEINVFATPVGLGNFNVNNLALFTSDAFLSNPDGDLYREYVSLDAVGTDFGTSTETYQQAAAVFSQVPNLLAAGGNLIIFPSFTNSSISAASIVAGGSGYTVGDILTVVESGGALGTLTVAAVTSSGTISSISITSGGIGYTVSGPLATVGGAGTGATVTVSAVTSETLAQAIQRCVNLVFFVGIISTNYGANTTWLALSAVVQALVNKLLFLPSNSQPDIPGVFTSITSATDNNVRCLFYSNSAALNARLFAAAYASRLLSVDFEGANTTLTMNLQQLQTIVADSGMTQTLKSLCQTAGVDIYPSTAGRAGVYSNGANKYADQVFNQIGLVARLQVAGFNALAQAGTKVPQTEPGVSVLKNAYKKVIDQFVTNGYIAPGAWNSSITFGDQAALISNVLQKGYYIYSVPVNSQSVADRAARQAPLISIAVKEAGAIHSSVVNVYVNP